MNSQGSIKESSIKDRLTSFANQRWDYLSDKQKGIAKKAWGMITYKWRWQLAMNIPYLAILLLDRTIPSVHQYNMAILSSVAAKLPNPAFISSYLGIG